MGGCRETSPCDDPGRALGGWSDPTPHRLGALSLICRPAAGAQRRHPPVGRSDPIGAWPEAPSQCCPPSRWVRAVPVRSARKRSGRYTDRQAVAATNLGRVQRAEPPALLGAYEAGAAAVSDRGRDGACRNGRTRRLGRRTIGRARPRVGRAFIASIQKVDSP